MYTPHAGGGQQQRAPMPNILGAGVAYPNTMVSQPFNMTMLQQPPPSFIQPRPVAQQMPTQNLMHHMPPPTANMSVMPPMHGLPPASMPTMHSHQSTSMPNPHIRSLMATQISVPQQQNYTQNRPPPYMAPAKTPSTSSIASTTSRPSGSNEHKQDQEPEDPFANSDYAIYESQSDASDDEKKKTGESRKRRRSRSRDRHRDRKHRRRRSRTRSPNQIRVPTGGKVYINPAINKIGLTTSVSALLEQSNQQEDKIRKLTEELNQANTRLRGMEAEIGNVHDEKQKLKNDLNRATQLATRKTTEVENIKKAESGFKTQLEAEKRKITAAEKERDAAKQKAKEAEERADSMQSELDFLRGRNEILVKKCEELIDKNRAMIEEKDEALRKVESSQREAELHEHELNLNKEQIKRLDTELDSSRNKEILWRRDRDEMERKLTAKERMIVSERTRLERELKREKMTRERLEKALHAKHPEADAITGIELLNRTLDSVKMEIDEQMRSLHQSVTPLQESLQKQVILRHSVRRAYSEPPI